ncbi:hypothetical protein I0C86_41230 [Plantactinospora sp. S1510]|uniref:Uncharacterized protein n=1 Tax=Plantactinospora alkalitolerans TaxID=2789879 RepID=A0ABS0H9W9_9ACTN|nr:hypothetical protein [Plantactinospora alkalitolerans]MBF9135276.1 hypothetical protein [Plantactinospora alkalitolerans]
MSVVISGPIDPELDGQLRQFLARLAEKKAAGELPDIEIIDNGVREG